MTPGASRGRSCSSPAQFNLSTSATEWITTFTGIGLIVGALATNPLSDRYVRKAAMVLMIVGYQVATVAGIMVAYFVAYALASSGGWRLMLGLSAVVSGLVLIVLVRLPDIARWYLMRGRREDALRTLRQADLRHGPIAAVNARCSGSSRSLLRVPATGMCGSWWASFAIATPGY